ncbi:MAG TPA: TlpA disulfide reductase family protein [Pyrinomonadaceae bacterium]|nr:TlpA disulfide reductase family protein [Pyrinomonadaceae bacterium]
MKRIFSLTFLCASLLLVAASARAQAPAAAGQLVPPPDSSDLKLRGADGKTYDVGGMRGQVVLVSFGATWCLPCKEELKALEQLKKEYKDKPVQFLWISIESEEEASDGRLREYAKGLKLSFPVLRDPDKSVFARYSQRLRMPTVLFFDREGKLSLPNHVGMADAPVYMAKMRARLDKLLTEEAATRPRRVGG